MKSPASSFGWLLMAKAGLIGCAVSSRAGWWRQGIDRTRAMLRLARNGVRLASNRADYDRWKSPAGLEEWWDERTRILADLIPRASTVIEFGAGRRQLEKYLPSDCVYVPSDLTDRGPGTIVCDLNKAPLPDLRGVAPTVAVFGGVLEYVKDVRPLITWLVESGVRTFIFSFDARPAELGWYASLREKRRRLYFGYMNSLTEQELLSILQAAGMQCTERTVWTTQGIYRFTRDTE